MKNTNIYRRLNNRNFLTLLFSMAILCFMAFYNGYPYLFNNDSAIYIARGYQGYAGPDRPILYSLFTRYTSIGVSLWPVVAVQAFLVSYIIYCYFRYFSSKSRKLTGFLLFITFITLFMSGSFYVSFIMPDVFTAIAIACLGLLLFSKRLPLREFIALSVITIISLGMHNANAYIFLGVMIVVLVGFADRTVRKLYSRTGIRLKRIVFVILLAIAGYLFSSTIHHFRSGEFKSSRGGVIFFMGNLVQMGIIDSYLNNECDTKDYTLCRYKDSIPSSFLWHPESPLQKEGGWKESQGEYSAIVKDILTTPKYVSAVAYKSGIYTLKQFFNFDAGPFNPGVDSICIPNNYVKTTIGNYYPGEYSLFSNSRQNREELSFKLLNFIQELVFGVFILLYVIILIYKKLSLRYRMFICFILIALVVNAWVYSTFSHAGGDRYQSHMIWLLPLPLFLYWNDRFSSSNSWIHSKIFTIREKIFKSSI